MRKFSGFSLLFSLLLVFSCQDDLKRDLGLLPSSSGSPLELLLVISDDLFSGQSGDVIIDELGESVEGLPQSESFLRVVKVASKDFKPLLKRSKLILLIEKDTLTARSLLNNVWAKPQLVLSYKGKTEADVIRLLAKHLKEDKQLLREFEEKQLLPRITKQKVLPSSFMKKNGLELTMPASFELNTDRDDISVFWSRNLRSDQCIMMYIRPMNGDASLMGGDIISVRDSVCKLYIPGEMEGSYMTTEHEYNPAIVSTDVNGIYSLEARGLWKLEGDFMGGPFINYTLFDEVNERIITLEGFVYAPQIEKRNLMFELECILRSAKLKHSPSEG